MILSQRLLMIGGCPGSGAQELRQLLSAHTDVSTPPDSSWITHLSRPAASRPRVSVWDELRADPSFNEWGLPNRIVAELAASHPTASGTQAIQLCFAAMRETRRPTAIVDLTPEHLLQFDQVSTALRDVAWGFMVRDPREVAPLWASLASSRGGIGPGALTWQRYFAAADRIGRVVPTFLTVRHEEMVDDPLGVVAGLLASPDRADHIATRIKPARIDWRRALTSREVATIEWICGRAMERLGYRRVTGSRQLRAAAAVLKAHGGELDRRWLTRRYGWIAPFDGVSFASSP